MFKKLLLVIGLGAGLAYTLAPTQPTLAQNTTCSDRPGIDVSNACANTRFVHNGFINCVIFTASTKGCTPASGGGTVNFLRADGTFAPTGAGGSAVVGMILPWAGASVPDTYLLTYGQAVSRTTYASLFSALSATATISCSSGSPNITVSADIANRMPIGGAIEGSACFVAGTPVSSKSGTTLTLSNNAGATTSTAIVFIPWGNGNGSTTFNVPNLMGRAIVGRDNMSGSIAGVLTSTYFGSNPDALGALGGSQSHTQILAELAAHTHTITDPMHSHNIQYNRNKYALDAGGADAANLINVGGLATGASVAAATGITGANSAGSGAAFTIVQPSVTIDFIIKALPDSAVGDSITIGVTNVAGGATTNILYNNAGKVGEYEIATAAQYLAGTPNKIVQAGVIYQAETTTTYGTTTTFDFSTFINTKVTLTGNITTQTLTNVMEGKAGMITFIQDGTGSRTTVWNSAFKFAGGLTPTLSTTASAIDVLNYSCRTTTFCVASLLKDVK